MIAAALCAQFAALLLLGVSRPVYWQTIAARGGIRRTVGAAAWILLLASLTGWSDRYGWEIGSAWFVLWAALAAMVATAVLSLRPRAAMVLGTMFFTAALGAWLL
ncbi:MAG: hypothetical protein AAF772_01225 [Acidobacteriota bacterium]